ncbi:MAG: hypothetical protein AAFP97_09780 [Pseudomonadota bacterium]
MRSNPRRTYKQARCALTASLRRRTQAAEARAEEAEEIAEAAEARAAKFYHEMQAERAALLDYLESPQWRRDLLVIARNLVRDDLLRLSATRQSCPSCGSFGRGFQEHFLQDAIDTLTKEHGLPRVSPLLPPDWPVRMGRVTKDGRGLHRAWLE